MISDPGDVLTILFYGVTERRDMGEVWICQQGVITESDLRNALGGLGAGVQVRIFMDISYGMFTMGLPWTLYMLRKPIYASTDSIRNNTILLTSDLATQPAALSKHRGVFLWALLQTLSEIHLCERYTRRFLWKDLLRIVQYRLWLIRADHQVRLGLSTVEQKRQTLDVV
jgi:hypothetical protein